LDYYAGPALAGDVGYDLDALRQEVEQHVRDSLAEAAATLPAGTETVLRSGDAAQALIERTEQLDLLVTGSRGYGPLRSVLVGGVSGKLIRDAHCPVIVVPRGAGHALSHVA
jgi:nucleotide-binding universal stress UspA family protein